MEIRIFNVDHGFCAYVIADNRNVILIDCGHNSTTGFRPSSYLRALGCTGIEHLIISNFDEDHLSDLDNLQRQFRIEILWRNRSIPPEVLRHLKRQSGPITSPLEAAINMHERYTNEDFVSPDLARIQTTHFCNHYPNFTDTNNLSLVTFLEYYNFSIVFPGDLEVAGWRALLGNSSFRHALARVNVFVASHHGRESGYCKEVFNFCTPDIIIISDTRIQYETQENQYRQHARGIAFDSGSIRRVLTTRSDGLININKFERNPYTIRIGG